MARTGSKQEDGRKAGACPQPMERKLRGQGFPRDKWE